MPVYHFTIHAYRSWRPDHLRGYTKYGAGYQEPDPLEAIKYDENAKQNAVEFVFDVQVDLYHLTRQVCDEEAWCFEAIAFDLTHMHSILSWKHFIAWEKVQERYKNLLAYKLNKRRNCQGKRWFVRRHGAPRRVRDRSHYDHLTRVYFPDHPGLYWMREMPVPRWHK